MLIKFISKQEKPLKHLITNILVIILEIKCLKSIFDKKIIIQYNLK